MDRSCLTCALCVIASLVALPTLAATIPGPGTWESTLEGRDLDGNSGTFEAFYDTALDITWLADANAAGTTMTWAAANAWATGLDVNGVTGWRLPTLSPINGTSFNMVLSSAGATDRGTATTTTDGSDGGWRDDNGTPVSEMGHMFYVTLGNLGDCNPALTYCEKQSGSGLLHTGPFSNIQSNFYWSDTGSASSAWRFGFDLGGQFYSSNTLGLYAWAVRSGDVSAVPVPAAVWLFGSGLLGLLGLARRKH